MAIDAAQAPGATATFQSQAEFLDAVARHEKRLEGLHRDRARAARRQLDALSAFCAENGIRLVIRHSPKEGTDR